MVLARDEKPMTIDLECELSLFHCQCRIHRLGAWQMHVFSPMRMAVRHCRFWRMQGSLAGARACDISGRKGHSPALVHNGASQCICVSPQALGSLIPQALCMRRDFAGNVCTLVDRKGRHDARMRIALALLPPL